MKQLVFIPLLILLTLLTQFFLPWWTLSFVCFGVCYFLCPSRFIAFTGSLLGVFLLWFIKAWMADGHFDTPMSSLLGNIFGGISGTAILFLTGAIGGLVGGLSGLLGSWTKMVISKT